MRVSALPRHVIPVRPSLLQRPTISDLYSSHARLLSTRVTSNPRKPWRPWLLVGVLGAVSLVSFQLWKPTRRVLQLNPDTFSQYVISDRVSASSTSSIFTLAPQLDNDAIHPVLDALFRDYLWSVQIKQPQLQIAREYTPLPLSEEEKREYGNEAFQLLIRREEQGEVSGWLHRLPVGAEIDTRGPRTLHKIPEEIVEILFLAGGTGITPALQLAHALLISKSSSTPLPKLRILWANRRRNDCMGGVDDKQKSRNRLFNWWPWADNIKEVGTQDATTSAIVKKLERLKKSFEGQLQVEYFVDEERTFITRSVLRSALISQEGSLTSNPGNPGAKKLILVSGPDGFVAHFAGRKGWSDRPEMQGELQGLLGDARFQGWEVWKL